MPKQAKKSTRDQLQWGNLQKPELVILEPLRTLRTPKVRSDSNSDSKVTFKGTFRPPQSDSNVTFLAQRVTFGITCGLTLGGTPKVTVEPLLESLFIFKGSGVSRGMSAKKP